MGDETRRAEQERLWRQTAALCERAEALHASGAPNDADAHARLREDFAKHRLELAAYRRRYAVDQPPIGEKEPA